MVLSWHAAPWVACFHAVARKHVAKTSNTCSRPDGESMPPSISFAIARFEQIHRHIREGRNADHERLLYVRIEQRRVQRIGRLMPCGKLVEPLLAYGPQ